MQLSDEELDALWARSVDDNLSRMIVGSEVRLLIAQAREANKLRREVASLKERSFTHVCGVPLEELVKVRAWVDERDPEPGWLERKDSWNITARLDRILARLRKETT